VPLCDMAKQHHQCFSQALITGLCTTTSCNFCQ
jgi:hypothetical protein